MTRIMALPRTGSGKSPPTGRERIACMPLAYSLYGNVNQMPLSPALTPSKPTDT